MKRKLYPSLRIKHILLVLLLSGIIICLGSCASSIENEISVPDPEEAEPELEMKEADQEFFDEDEVLDISPSESVMRSSSAPESPMQLSGSGEEFSPDREKSEVEPESPDSTGIETARRLATRENLRVRTPELLARTDSSELKPVPLVSHDISVVIAGHKARVVQDMVFKNPSSSIITGTLMIELPDGASPCYLGMFQGIGPEGNDIQDGSEKWLNPAAPGIEDLLASDIKMENGWENDGFTFNWGEQRSAKVINPVKGREVYEQITRRRIDPALSEWAGSGKFSTRIYPIDANGYKRVVFAYDRPVTEADSSVIYNLPLPEKTNKGTRLTVYDIEGNFSQREVYAGENKLNMDKTLFGGKWQLYPEMDFSGNMIFRAKHVNPSFQVLTGKDEAVSGNLVSIRIKPDISEDGNPEPTGRALFILDTSYSSKDKLAALSGKMIRQLLENDQSITEFAVAGFDVRCRWITEGFVSNNQQEQENALASIERIWLEGATNFTSVMDFIHSNEIKADTIFLLSDGQITWGVENPNEFESGFPEIINNRWICYSFADASVNRQLFNLLSNQRGQIVHTGIGEDLVKAAEAHLKPVSILNSVYTSAQDDILVSGDPSLIYPGQILEASIRIKDNRDTVDVFVVINGEKQQFTIPLQFNEVTSGIAARAWADLHVSRLLDYYDKGANLTALALSQRFSLTNREASFIILETDEEYVEHRIDNETLDLRQLRESALRRIQAKPFGAPETDDLTPESLNLVTKLASIPGMNVWNIPEAKTISDSLKLLISKPSIREDGNNPVLLYNWAQDLFLNNSNAIDRGRALRILSTIAELKPQDDAGLRLLGFVLLEWGLYKEAETLFAKVRMRRPFEPQAFLLEGMALAAQQKISEAALRYEIVLQREFPRFEYEIDISAEKLYTDLLESVIRTNEQDEIAALCRNRLKEINDFPFPAGRLFLFWNLDDTDVDLHVKESLLVEISYENMRSASGGELFWDNTTGLGPELYEHPKLSTSGYDVFVNYFGSSSVEGAAPAATLVSVFTADPKRTLFRVNWYTTVLTDSDSDKVSIMPKWKRW